MSRILLIVTVLLLVATTVSVWMTKDKTAQNSQMPVTSSGEAAIGGNFTLTDQDGKPASASDFRGKVMLVFFGFTHCPDICPVTVATLAKTLTMLGDKATQVAAIFITVDPERDTPDILKSYLGNVDKRLIGLTGTPDAIKQTAAAYKAYYAKNQPAESAAAPGDYQMDHSGFLYVMDKDGKYITHFPYDADAKDIAAAVKPLVN